MIDRRLRGVLVLVAGAFLITLAALVHLYIYPSGLVLPAEQDRITKLTTESGSYFDAATLRTHRGVPLETAVARYGDTVRSTPDVAVWTEFVSLATRDGQRIDYHERRVAFDRRTGQAVNCCENYVDENGNPAPRGLVFRWPFGAGPVAYQVYDPLVRRPVAARFEGIETLYGVRVNRYAQRLVNERLVQQAMELPGTVLGLGGRKTFPVNAYLDGARTFWVEPESGMVIGVRENLVKTLRTDDGGGRLVALAADMRTSTGDERWNAGEARQFLRWATLVNRVIPLSCAVLGVLLLVAGLRLQSRASAASVAPAPTSGDPAAGSGGAGDEGVAGGADGLDDGGEVRGGAGVSGGGAAPDPGLGSGAAAPEPRPADG
ncbi:DUF3068 domain-containing protein [Streptosporangium sp. NPDC049304]|uniref:DUF3068 domain-containing protein n=1 Tax=Streptosporangium sp. NPDC049304 TaxID=3154830 RepID=UPI00342CAF68